jgi:hypothetical protein
MKHRWCVIDESTKQVLFNLNEDEAFRHSRHTIQRYKEDLTIKDLEKKYAIKTEYRQLDNHLDYWGYFVV